MEPEENAQEEVALQYPNQLSESNLHPLMIGFVESVAMVDFGSLVNVVSIKEFARLMEKNIVFTLNSTNIIHVNGKRYIGKFTVYVELNGRKCHQTFFIQDSFNHFIILSEVSAKYFQVA